MSTEHQPLQSDTHRSSPEHMPHLAVRIHPLNISPAIIKELPSEFLIGSTAQSALVSPLSVAAHLRLLGAFHNLELTVSSRRDPSDRSNPPGAVRWRVFVHQAVGRFETWLKRIISSREINDKYLRDEEIPPLDVILVWHAYLLHPLVYADDSTRVYPKLGALPGLPLERIAEQIDPMTLMFQPTPEQTQHWKRMAQDSPEPPSLTLPSREILTVDCPRCDGPPVQVSWVSRLTIKDGYAKGMGWCQNDFSVKCEGCGLKITRESIAVGRFAADIAAALKDGDAILPGTLYDPRMCTLVPEKAQYLTAILLQPYVDMTTKREIGDSLDWSFSNIKENIIHARLTLVGACAAMHTYMNNRQTIGLPTREDRQELRARILVAQKSIENPRSNWRPFGLSIAKMLASYKDNPTPFSTELVSAIIRQTSFTSKAFKLGWLDPSNSQPPIAQSIKRYHNFLHLLSRSKECLVPTLDIDLSWHTHQLAGNGYMSDMMRCVGRYVDHDDRVEEGVLSDGFDITSREWKRTFNTQYSSCDHTHRTDTFSKTANSRKNSTKSSGVPVPDLNTYPSEHPNTVIIKNNTIASRRKKRERKRAKDHSIPENEVPFVKTMHMPEGVEKVPSSGIITFGALGLAGWALFGNVDPCILDANTADKGQCCGGFGMPYYGGPLWVGGSGSISDGGCTAKFGCVAGSCSRDTGGDGEGALAADLAGNMVNTAFQCLII